MTDTAFAPLAFPVVTDAGVRDRVASAEVRGHAAGYAAGLRAAHVETEALRAELEAAHVARLERLDADTARRITALATATDALAGHALPLLASAEESVVAAAVELAEAAVGYAIRASRPSPGAAGDGLEAVHPSGAEATVRRALALVDHTVAIAVRLSKADAAEVAGLDLPVVVRADAALSDGDAVVDLPDGMLDARIASALARAKDALGVTP